MTHFHAGQNMPGYMPMSDENYAFESFEDAKASMIDELDRDGDFHFATGSDEAKALADELSGVMQDLNLVSGPEWSVVVGNMSYWIVTCDESECEEDEL